MSAIPMTKPTRMMAMLATALRDGDDCDTQVLLMLLMMMMLMMMLMMLLLMMMLLCCC